MSCIVDRARIVKRWYAKPVSSNIFRSYLHDLDGTNLGNKYIGCHIFNRFLFRIFYHESIISLSICVKCPYACVLQSVYYIKINIYICPSAQCFWSLKTRLP